MLIQRAFSPTPLSYSPPLVVHLSLCEFCMSTLHTCSLEKWYLIAMCFDYGVIHGVEAKMSAPLLSSSTFEYA